LRRIKCKRLILLLPPHLNSRVAFLGRIPIELAIVGSTVQGKPFIWVYEKASTARLMDEVVGMLIWR